MHRHIVTGTATALVGLLSAWLFASENPPIDLGNDIENLLSHLTRLTPDSALADKLNEGWKAWTEYRSKRPL